MYNQNRQEYWSHDIVDSQGHHNVLLPHILHWLLPGAVYIFSEVHQSSRCSSNFNLFCQLTDTSLILCHSLFQINISFPSFRSHAHFFPSICPLGKVIFQPGHVVKDFVYIFAARVETPVPSIILKCHLLQSTIVTKCITFEMRLFVCFHALKPPCSFKFCLQSQRHYSLYSSKPCVHSCSPLIIIATG